MPMIIAGLLLLWLSSVLLRGFMRANPAGLARLLRKAGGTVGLVMAVLLILRGEFNLSLLAAGAGIWLLNARPKLAVGASSGTGRRRRGAEAPWTRPSDIRSRSLDVSVDPRTGRISGRFRDGPYAGHTLDGMSQTEAVGSYRWCLAADPSGAALLEAYLDRRFAGWREAAEFGGNAGRAETGRGAGPAPRMSDHEAYHVLGLAEGASREEVARAHRHLMKKHHPDHGGSTDLAARVNEAKDVLLRRHR